MRYGNSFLNPFPAWRTALFLFFTTLFIRFPFFFRDYIDRDESTFILMGQSIADGNLPYVHLWDLKPPLLFYLFGAIESLFPHSFVAIRFFGVLIVFTSALLLMLLAKQYQLKNGILIALFYVILSSELGNLQGLMSEHVAVVFLLLGLVLFKKKGNAFHLTAGLAFGCALLCKLSYAYAIAALLAFSLFINWRIEPISQLIKSNVLLVCGILLPFLLIACPFYANNKTDVFINAVFLAPFEYGHAQQLSFSRKIGQTWWIVLLSLLLTFLTVKYGNKENREGAFLLTAILLGTVYTFFSSGIVNSHYLILAYPFILLLALGTLIRKELRVKPYVLILFVVLVSAESILEYYRIISSYSKHGSVYYRPGFQVADELKRRKLDKSRIFFAEYHIGYWLLNQYPLTKSTTHPSNLARPFLFKYFGASKTSLDELKYLMEMKKPDVIVGKTEHLGFFPEGEENTYFIATTKRDFRIIYRDDKNHIIIWQRN